MTGRQLVRFLGRAPRRAARPGRGRPLAKRLDIDLDRPLTHLSSGMKRKVALLAVLVPQVPLVILDEPTNTLDPTHARRAARPARAGPGRGQAVLFSSHVLHEVEAVCDRVAILRRGQLVHLQEMAELREGRLVRARLRHPADRPGRTARRLPIADGAVELEYRGPLPELLAWLNEHPPTDVRIEPLGLGPLYTRLHGADEAILSPPADQKSPSAR